MSCATASRRVRRQVTGALLTLTAAAHVAAASFDEDFDDEKKPWSEIAVQLPPAPQPENLAPFDVGPTATQSFAVDLKSISIGSDGVVRYTLVATSPAGARNVSYEGLRCATYERKLYAFGRPDGSWSRSRRDQWETIVSYGASAQHAVLAKQVFCEGKTVAGGERQMVDRLRARHSSTPLNSN